MRPLECPACRSLLRPPAGSEGRPWLCPRCGAEVKNDPDPANPPSPVRQVANASPAEQPAEPPVGLFRYPDRTWRVFRFPSVGRFLLVLAAWGLPCVAGLFLVIHVTPAGSDARKIGTEVLWGALTVLAMAALSPVFYRIEKEESKRRRVAPGPTLTRLENALLGIGLLVLLGLGVLWVGVLFYLLEVPS